MTDRCNFRCHYCMPENMKFMSKDQIMDYSQIALIADRFIHHGIKKIRLTGGEPLMRRDIDVLIEHLGSHVKSGRLSELTLTTNGSTLSKHSEMLYRNGVRRINVSLDTLCADRFKAITRRGDLNIILDGIQSAKKAGLAVKINMVALKNQNQDEILSMALYCADNDFGLSIIETMPLGDMDGRLDQYIALPDFIAPLTERFKITPIAYKSAGPANYFNVTGLSSRNLKLGLITPLSKNFCDDCNRLRLTTDGKLYMCLGSDMFIDFKQAMQNGGREKVDALLQKALKLKPEKHHFGDQMTDDSASVSRHMNVTGG